MSGAQDSQPQRGCILAVGKGMGSKEYRALEVISAHGLGKETSIKKQAWSHEDGSAGKGACCPAWGSEFNPQDPHRERETRFL